jgi:hypothetical protein
MTEAIARLAPRIPLQIQANKETTRDAYNDFESQVQDIQSLAQECRALVEDLSSIQCHPQVQPPGGTIETHDAGGEGFLCTPGEQPGKEVHPNYQPRTAKVRTAGNPSHAVPGALERGGSMEGTDVHSLNGVPAISPVQEHKVSTDDVNIGEGKSVTKHPEEDKSNHSGDHQEL